MGALIVRALLFGVYIRAPHCCKSYTHAYLLHMYTCMCMLKCLRRKFVLVAMGSCRCKGLGLGSTPAQT